jgi:hypothetical protein
MPTGVESQEAERAKKKIRGGRVAVFVIAGLALLVGLLFVGMGEAFEDMGYDRELIPAIGIAALVLGGIFLALGFWSKSQPYPALLIAMIIYGLNAVLTLVNLAQTGGQGAFSLLIVGLLLGLIIRGWIGARDLQKLKQGGGSQLQP